MKPQLSIMEIYAIEYTIRLLEQIKFAPRGQAHNLAVKMIVKLEDKLKENL